MNEFTDSAESKCSLTEGKSQDNAMKLFAH